MNREPDVKACLECYNLSPISLRDKPMLEKLEAILDRFAELDRRLAEAGTDFQLMAELSKERSDLEPIVNLASEYKENLAKTEETEALIT